MERVDDRWEVLRGWAGLGARRIFVVHLTTCIGTSLVYTCGSNDLTCPTITDQHMWLVGALYHRGLDAMRLSDHTTNEYNAFIEFLIHINNDNVVWSEWWDECKRTSKKIKVP